MLKSHKWFTALMGITVLGLFSAAQAGEKHDHGKGPNGGEVVEVGDEADHHLEMVHDAKTGKLVINCFKADLKTPFTPKESIKINLKAKDGNKQIEMKGAESKWEATDDMFKETDKGPSFEKAYSPRLVVVLPDGKKYNITLEEHKH